MQNSALDRVGRLASMGMIFFFAVAWRPAYGVETEEARRVLLEKWREHLANRSRIRYRFHGEYILPSDLADHYQREGETALRQTGERFAPHENHFYDGFYARFDKNERLDVVAKAKQDEATLLDKQKGSADGKTVRVVDHVHKNVEVLGPEAFDKEVYNPERDIRHLRCFDPLETWLKEAKFAVREEKNDAGHLCWVLNETWEAKDPTGRGTWRFTQEKWFDTQTGFLPCMAVTGPRFLNGQTQGRPYVTQYTVEEATPGVFLVTGFDAEMPTDQFQREMGKWRVGLTDIEVGEAAGDLVAWLPDGKRVRDLERDLRMEEFRPGIPGIWETVAREVSSSSKKADGQTKENSREIGLQGVSPVSGAQGLDSDAGRSDYPSVDGPIRARLPLVSAVAAAVVVAGCVLLVACKRFQ